MSERSTSDRNALIRLSLLLLATSLPFIHRAYFVDDYYFVTMAKGIMESPLRPYDFKSDDAGIGNVAWVRGQLPRMVNPPLNHYYIAGVIKVFGEETWKLRSAHLVFSFISLFAMYFLGKRFVQRPYYAAVLMAVTPAFWLTSYSLLIDGPLLAFTLASLLVWIKAHEKHSVKLVLWSGLLMGLTMLVKYTGVLAVLLALVWQMSDTGRRSWKKGYLAYAVFLLVQGLWASWNIATYGQSHLFASLGRGMTSFSPLLVSQKAIVVGSFIGGATIFVLFSFLLVLKISKFRTAALTALGVLLVAIFSSDKGGFSVSQAVLLSAFLIGSLSFLVVVRESSPSKDKNRNFLLFWVFSAALMLVTVMPWTAGRYLLCLLPPLCWLFSDLMDQWGTRALKKLALVVTAGFGLVIAHGDYQQANTIMKLAGHMEQKAAELEKLSPKSKHHWYYLSDTFDGAQPYLAPLGWENALPDQRYKPGDLLMRAYFRRSSWWDISETLKSFEWLSAVDMQSVNPVRTMDVPASAGFYASCWGALPWVITIHPLERYELYRAKAK